MKTPLNVLIVEDSPDDAELLVRELRRAGFEPKWKRVETEPDFLAEFKNSPNIILSDYSMPQFSGLRAAELTQKSGLGIPFILISGTVGEEAAVEAMKLGATDYFLKDRLARLGSAVKRALREAKARMKLKLAEETLRESERRFSDMLDKVHLVSVMLDDRARVTYCNDYLLELTGWKRAEVLGKNWFETFVPREIRDKIKNVFSELITNRPEAWHYQNEIITRSGKWRLVRWNNSILRSPSGEIVGTASMGEDITDRELAEQASRESELKFRQIAENINEVFWITDPAKHQMLYISPAYESIWGRTCQSLYDSPQAWLEAIHPDDRNRVFQAAMTKQAVDAFGAYDEEYRIIRPDGGVRWIHDRAFPVRNAAGEIYRVVGVAEDITERQKLQEQFRQAQKMEAVGQLAGGVAHDFNNILAVIQMQADLMKMEENLSPAHKELADDIIAAAQRAAALTRQLLLFSRKETMRQQDLDLNESINNIAKMLRRILRESIQLQFKFSMQPMFVHADAGMLDQVLMNLCVNARDAMAEGGKLIIETSTVEFDEQAASQSAKTRPGSFVCLSVTDTGCGITPENLQHIFEPFFTTKEIGKGTGLGLATAFGIVQQHQGWINVYSEIDRGTTFRIYLPRLEKMFGQKIEQPALTTLPGGNETVLLAEDDSYLRAFARKMLSQLGYRVLEAVNGVEALEIWKQHRDEIHLLLTDMVMPGGITGEDLGERLLRENPKLKIIYLSGYSAEVAGTDFPLEDGVNFISKPFQAAKLAQTIRARLDD